MILHLNKDVKNSHFKLLRSKACIQTAHTELAYVYRDLCETEWKNVIQFYLTSSQNPKDHFQIN